MTNRNNAAGKGFHGFSSESGEAPLDSDDDTAVTKDEIKNSLGRLSPEEQRHYYEKVANPQLQHIALHNMIADYDWTRAWVEYGGGSNHHRLIVPISLSFCPMCGLSEAALTMIDRSFTYGAGRWPNDTVTEIDLYPPELDWP